MSSRYLAIAFLVFETTVATLTLAAVSPTNLTCEYNVNPLGIDSSLPRLAWMLTSQTNGELQTAYEIVVSESVQKIQKHEGDAWSTGKVESSANIQIDYAGVPLKSMTRYYWSVRVYGADGKPSAWSTPAWFETALLDRSEWKAKWIGDGSRQFENDQDFYQDDRMPLFRREINVKKKLSSARLYISGMGYYEAQLNGKTIGDHVLDPGWTSYKKTVLYVTHDITAILKTGRNTAGIMLGNGWWNPLPLRLFNRFNLRDFQQTGRPCVLAEIHLNYSDGTKDIITTDETWKSTTGPVVRNNVYLGEHYDARFEQNGWSSNAGSEQGWKNAEVVNGPFGNLKPQMQPPIRITKVVKPVSVKQLKPGVYMVDMGQNFAGVPRITVSGPAGSRIVMRYGEALHPDGTLNFLTTVAGQIKEMWKLDGGPGAPATAWQEDRYTLKGNGKEIWSPRFTFHGFRYIEITGWPGTPRIADIEGLRMNSDLDITGTFSSSNEMFNRIHEVSRWTFLSNVFSVQSDCPGREKMGYGADMVTTANTFLYNFNMATFYGKAVQDFADEQLPDGGITEIAPYTGIHDRGVGGDSGPLGWQLAFAYLQKQLYQFYGDKRIVARHYPAVIRQIAFLKHKAVDGLFYWDISDHEAIDPKPEALSASAFYYHHVKLASEFADILGKSEDAEEYAKLAAEIKQNIISKYLVRGTGRFDNGTQSAQLFALWYGLTPEPELSTKVLMDEFKRHNWHVSSGIFGVSMMFDWLRTSDQPEAAYRIANQKDYPGWGHMIANGATTLWESWEYPDNGPSQNHPMFGSIDEWFYRSLLGINPLDPGFKRIMIKPQAAGDLTSAKGNYRSIMGNISSDWQIEGKQFTLATDIPVNCTAEVWVRCSDQSTLSLNGTAYTDAVEMKNGYAVVKVGSGKHIFRATR